MKRLMLPVALALTLPGVMAGLGLVPMEPVAQALASGLAVVAAAYLMLWALRRTGYMPRTLALMAAALAVALPELSADVYLAWTDGFTKAPGMPSLAFASITGASRLMVGLAWPLVILLYWLRNRGDSLRLDMPQRRAMSMLFLLSLYAFTIYARGYVSPLDALVVLVIAGVYAWRSHRPGPASPQGAIAFSPDAVLPPFGKGGLGGISTYADCLPKSPLAPLCQRGEVGGCPAVSGENERRSSNGHVAAIATFSYGALATLLAAGPLASGLLLTGLYWSMDQFTLVQWAVPLASKAPWLVVAAALVWRARAGLAVNGLLLSQVGLWAIAMAALPLAVSWQGVALGNAGVLELDDRQRSELLLMIAQSLFMATLLSGHSLSWRGALAALALFSVQGLLTTIPHASGDAMIRGALAMVYLGTAITLVMVDRARLHALVGVSSSNPASLLRREVGSVRK